MVLSKTKPKIREVKHLKSGKKHSPKIKQKAFKIWTRCHNFSEVRREIEQQDNVHISLPTLIRWAEAEDWEAKEAIEGNELRRLLKTSDDPVLKQLVMNDIEFIRVMKLLSSLVNDVLKRPRKYGVKIRSYKEVVDIVKFLRDEREKLLDVEGNKQVPIPGDGKPASFTYNDNRKMILRGQIMKLPADQRADMFDQIISIEQDHPELEAARRQILDAKVQ
jgi:hypothetical protein